MDGKTKYEVDAQLVVTITKYKLVYDKNAPELPKKLKNNVVYGSYLKSIVALLNIEHAVSVSRTVDIIRELTKGVINLSTGTILNIEYELKDKVQPSNSCIKDYLLRCEVNHKDETMVFCNGESRWFHTFGNKLATLYY